MELVTPSVGLLFWMLIGFGILFAILAKFAWPVITSSISKRENFIEEQLDAAKKVKEEMKNLQSEHAKLLVEAKEERDKIIADARKLIEKTNEEARIKREKENEQMLQETRKTIQNEKMKAITDLKNEIGMLSIDVAEKILRQELSTDQKKEEVIRKWISEM